MSNNKAGEEILLVATKSYSAQYLQGFALYHEQTEGLLTINQASLVFKTQSWQFDVPLERIFDLTISETDDTKKAIGGYLALGMMGVAATRSMSKIRVMKVTFVDAGGMLQSPEFRFLPKSAKEVDFIHEAAAEINNGRRIRENNGRTSENSSEPQTTPLLIEPQKTSTIPEPQPTILPNSSPPKKPNSKKRIAIALTVIIGVILMGLIASYFVAQSSVAGAAAKFTTTTGNLEITNLSLVPLSADLKGDIIMNNPTNIDFTINKAQADLYVKYGNDITSLGTFDVSDKSLPSNGYTTIPLTMHFGSDIINFLSTHSSGYSMVFSGTLKLSGKSSFWTITSERSFSYEQNIDSLNSNQNLFPSPEPTESPSWTYPPYTYPPVTSTPAPTQNPSTGFSRSNPAPIGTTMDISFQYLYKTYYARITVLQVVRGSQAWSMLQEANMFNSPAKTGFEYVVAKIRFEYYQGPTSDTQFSLTAVDFAAISKTGVTYDASYAVDPEPSLTTSLYPGASHEGWGTYQVAIDDSNPLLAFAREYDGTGGVWFSLTQTSSTQS